MPNATRHKLERFLPYAYERFGIELELLGCELDGRAGPEPQSEPRVLALDAEPWRRARVHYRVSVPERTLKAVLPPSDRASRPAALLLIMRCPSTRLRRGLRIALAPRGGHAIDGALVIERDECEGTLELMPYLVRETAGGPAPGYARRPGERLASARPWLLRVHAAPSISGKFLDVRYRSFKEDALLASFQDNVYRLECDQDAPVLWINADHDKLSAVLDERATTGKKARLRDVFYDLVAQGVWSQLFVRAVSDLDESEEQAESTYGWQDGVLREVLPFMFPASPSHAERVRELLRLRKDDLALLIDRLDAALQAKSQLAAHMSSLAEELLEAGKR
ncbi:MAG TPA: hypothetical protein VK509_07470 [Polyangiales bacterium]|nr:hypothetical protein [Polyangiales bacterium]